MLVTDSGPVQVSNVLQECDAQHAVADAIRAILARP
jgi:hypothetical protein